MTRTNGTAAAPARRSAGQDSGPASRSAMREGGWLSGESIFERRDRRKLGRSLVGSLIVHALVLGLVMIAMSLAPAAPRSATIDTQADLIYVPAPQQGGGGGGRPAPSTPRPVMQQPQDMAPQVAPVPLEPPPSIASLLTPTTSLLAFGPSASLSSPGSGGDAPGPGTGPGSGPGSSGPGCCGDALGAGNGVSTPVPVFHPDPTYTAEAMRAKVQGTVLLTGVVDTNGRFTDARVVQSLDRAFGLDDEAVRTALTWTFKPGMKDGKPVRVFITIEMQFTLR